MSARIRDELVEAVRLAVAAMGQEQPGKVLFVMLHRRPRVRHDGVTVGENERYLLRRVWTGFHKELDAHRTVVIGVDLARRELGTFCLAPRDWSDVDVRVSTVPVDGIDVPFEGVFDLKKLSVGAVA